MIRYYCAGECDTWTYEPDDLWITLVSSDITLYYCCGACMVADWQECTKETL